MAHSCVPSTRYSSSATSGCGCFVATRSVAAGEPLTTNYLGEYSGVLSTPARQAALLQSKLFECACSLCASSSDTRRDVPCPGCHARRGDEKQLDTAVALGSVTVHYASPLYSADGAGWLCRRCGAEYSADAVLAGPSSQGGLSGRAWEAVVEQHVLSLDRRWVETGSIGCRSGSAAFGAEVANLHWLVAHSLGSRHWSTQRLAAMKSTCAS